MLFQCRSKSSRSSLKIALTIVHLSSQLCFYIHIRIQGYALRSKNSDDYSSLAKHILKEKRKRGGIVVMVKKRIRLKYRDVVMKNYVASHEEVSE